MNITLWNKSDEGHWETTHVLPGDVIIVHVRDRETIFVYQRHGRYLAVRVDDLGNAYEELVFPVYFQHLQTLLNALNQSLRSSHLQVQLQEIAPCPVDGDLGEFKSAAFLVIAC